MIDSNKYVMSKYVTKEDLLSDKCNDLEKEVKLLRQRLHNSKRDNRTNRDRLRNTVLFYHKKYVKLSRNFIEVNRSKQ
jgi:hypothetical protein